MKGVRVRVWVRNQIPAYPRVKVNVEKKRRKKTRCRTVSGCSGGSGASHGDVKIR